MPVRFIIQYRRWKCECAPISRLISRCIFSLLYTVPKISSISYPYQCLLAPSAQRHGTGKIRVLCLTCTFLVAFWLRFKQPPDFDVKWKWLVWAGAINWRWGRQTQLRWQSRGGRRFDTFYLCRRFQNIWRRCTFVWASLCISVPGLLMCICIVPQFVDPYSTTFFLVKIYLFV